MQSALSCANAGLELPRRWVGDPLWLAAVREDHTVVGTAKYAVGNYPPDASCLAAVRIGAITVEFASAGR